MCLCTTLRVTTTTAAPRRRRRLLTTTLYPLSSAAPPLHVRVAALVFLLSHALRGHPPGRSCSTNIHRYNYDPCIVPRPLPACLTIKNLSALQL